MNKFLRVLFIILMVAMGGAMIYQIFFPEVDTELQLVGNEKLDFGIWRF